MSKTIVLGAGGFIGKHMVRELANDKDTDVVAFDRFSHYKKGDNSPFGELNNVTIVPGNFFNRDELADVLRDADFVFHFISSTNPATSNNDAFIDIDTNVRSSIELLELCVEQHVKKVIFPSSGGTVYGDIDSEKISENTVPAPRSPYGIGKLTVEHFLRYFKYTKGLDYVVYRIANPYGPGQNIFGKQGVIPIFMNKFLHHEPITIFGDGSMVRDYIYIDDLIDMISRSYTKDNIFNEYNLGSGGGLTITELIQAIESCTGQTAKKEYVDTPPTFVHKSVLDKSRFTSEFGNKSLTSIEVGIRKTWDYVKQFS